MKTVKSKIKLASIIILVLSLTALPVFSFVYQKTTGEILRNSIFALFQAIGLLYLIHYSLYNNLLSYDNAEHPIRFMNVFVMAIVFSMFFPIVDINVWFYLAIGISISLFSNSLIAIYSVCILLLNSILLSSNADYITFFVYFFPAIIGIILFLEIDKNFNVSSSVIICILIQFVVQVSGFILLKNEALTAEQFILPIVNTVINVLICIFILKFFNQVVANKYRNKYLELNDQEYRALIALKEISREEYFRSIHTAYLVERMATAIGCDVNAAKNCAYYHRIKKVFDFSEAQCDQFTVDNEFPPRAKELLLDFLDKNKRLIERESCIVFISDKFISTLMTAFKKDKTAKIDYKSLVDVMFDKDFMKNTLSDSLLSQRDLKIIKEILLKEELYYDFLR